MNILNQPIKPGGHPVFPAAKETLHADGRQVTPAPVRFDGLTQPSTVAAGRSHSHSPRWQAQTLRRASSYVGVEHDEVSGEQLPAPFRPLTLSFLRSLLENDKMSTITDGVVREGNADGGHPQALHALRVVVSSAVKLDARQTELIARKMQRITGFVDLALENVIDPSLIAGFVICYGEDDSQIIDLSVKGQLTALKNRVESFDQSEGLQPQAGLI